MKKKHLNTLKIASLTLMLGCFAVGGVYNHYQDKQQEHVFKVERNNLQVPRQYVSYDDENYTITLTADELNNYTWTNLGAELYSAYEDYSSGIITSLTYNLTQYSYSEGTLSNDYIYLSYNEEPTDNYIYFGMHDFNPTYVNRFTLSIEDEFENFNYSLIITFNSDLYSYFKSAVQLDIQANQPVSMGESIIGSIASGLGIIPNIAGEFLAGFSKLLWNNNQLTDFAIYSLVFLGIAITFAIVKLVLMIVKNNTGA